MKYEYAAKVTLMQTCHTCISTENTIINKITLDDDYTKNNKERAREREYKIPQLVKPSQDQLQREWINFIDTCNYKEHT